MIVLWVVFKYLHPSVCCRGKFRCDSAPLHEMKLHRFSFAQLLGSNVAWSKPGAGLPKSGEVMLHMCSILILQKNKFFYLVSGIFPYFLQRSER